MTGKNNKDVRKMFAAIFWLSNNETDPGLFEQTPTTKGVTQCLEFSPSVKRGAQARSRQPPQGLGDLGSSCLRSWA
jgi:hypothetical protein